MWVSLCNTTGLTYGAGTTNLCRAHEFTSDFSRVRVARSFVFCVFFVVRCLSFCPLFVHCVDCPTLTFGFWLPLKYLQTFLVFIIVERLVSDISSIIEHLQTRDWMFCIVQWEVLYLYFLRVLKTLSHASRKMMLTAPSTGQDQI